MKTQIIQLEENEDVISVRDKMNWNQAKRILLVWPKAGQPLQRKLDLNLVARHASNLGAQIGLVSNDRQVLENASKLGIPVFSSARQAQEIAWINFPRAKFGQKGIKATQLLEQRLKVHPRTPTWSDHRIVKITCVVISGLAVFILGIFLLPGAEISFSPLTESQSMVFELIADPHTSSINYSTGTVPTYSQEVIVEGHASLPASGSVTIAASSAKGTLSFTNLTNQSVIIHHGTIVTTSGDKSVRFITTSAFDSILAAYETMDLPAQAMEPGTSGNLSAYELDTIEGELSKDLEVFNPDDMTGGSELRVASPTSADLAKLHEQLLNNLLQDALVQLQSVVPNGDVLLQPSLSITRTINDTSFPAVGQPGNDLELSMRIAIQAQLVSSKVLHDLVIPVMNSYTPYGYSNRNNTLEIAQLKNPLLNSDGKTYWTIRATRQLQAAIPAEQIAALASGKSIPQAVQVLSTSLPLARLPEISLMPSWWPRLPFLAMRIQVLQAELQ